MSKRVAFYIHFTDSQTVDQRLELRPMQLAKVISARRRSAWVTATGTSHET